MNHELCSKRYHDDKSNTLLSKTTFTIFKYATRFFKVGEFSQNLINSNERSFFTIFTSFFPC